MKTKPLTTAAVALRIALGWLMFFAGFEKVIDPSWTASSFLQHAATFPQFYAWFALPMNSWWVDPLNAWGIMLVGVALIVGVALRPAALAGAMLMILYYFPHNAFPHVDHGYIVEEHIIYALVFIVLMFLPQARAFSLAPMIQKTFIGRIPGVKKLI